MYCNCTALRPLILRGKAMIHTAVNKSKFKKLKRQLAIPHYAVIGVLESIWHIGLSSCQDGAIGRMTNEDIAAELEWAGNPDDLIRSLVDCGWLDLSTEHRLVIHDWEEHCPRFVKGAMAKHGKRFAKSDVAIADYIKQAAMAGCHSTVPHNITKQNQTKPNQTEGLASWFMADAPPDENKNPVVIYPCSGKQPSWGLMQSQIDEWGKLYSGIDVLNECLKALGWINAQTIKKTAKGMPRFLTSWLSRATDRPRGGFQTRQNSLENLSEKRDVIGMVGQIPENDPILASMRRSIRPNPAAMLSLPPNFVPNGRLGSSVGNQSILEDRSSKTILDGNTEESKNG